MGKFNPNNNNQIYQELTGALAGSVFSAPAFTQNKIYYGAVGDNIKAFAFNSNAKLNSTPQSQTSTSFGYPGATPSISGSSKSDLILWAARTTLRRCCTPTMPTTSPSSCTTRTRPPGGRDHFGNGNKFITPMIANGKVYVGTQTGVGVLGLLP